MEGIHKRFAVQMEDIYCLLAAVFHSEFKLAWLSAHGDVKFWKVRDKMVSLVDNKMGESIADSSRKTPTAVSRSSTSLQRMRMTRKG